MDILCKLNISPAFSFHCCFTENLMGGRNGKRAFWQSFKGEKKISGESIPFKLFWFWTEVSLLFRANCSWGLFDLKQNDFIKYTNQYLANILMITIHPQWGWSLFCDAEIVLMRQHILVYSLIVLGCCRQANKTEQGKDTVFKYY